MSQAGLLELAIAKEAAAKAGGVLADFFKQGLDARTKPGDASYNLVSDADVQAERAIIDVLTEAFPDHSIFGEEERKDCLDAEHLWVIDPLDGTNNFLHGMPHFAVSIGYFHNGTPQCGVVFNPARDDWYTARRGCGAEHNGRPLRVSPCTSLDQVLAGVGFYYDRGVMMRSTLAAVQDLFEQQIHGIRRMGTAALDLCMVGTGQFGAFFEYQLSPWDFAAGRLFVEEAGGVVTTCAGDTLPLEVTTVLAASPGLHNQVLEITTKHLPSK